jgi:hypothetical protein
VGSASGASADAARLEGAVALEKMWNVAAACTGIRVDRQFAAPHGHAVLVFSGNAFLEDRTAGFSGRKRRN